MTDICTLQDFMAVPRTANTLRLMSFNMQVGIQTAAYHHYLLKSWQHFLPARSRETALSQIAKLVQEFDLVALQEADAGSFRSSRLNQVERLALDAGFPYWYQQVNRNLGQFARHSNGVLTRLPAVEVEQFALPGLLPGRGLMILKFGEGEHQLTVAITHLALGKRTQFNQLAFLIDQVADAKNLIIMGDLNQEAEVLLTQSPLSRLNLQPLMAAATYPSWQPQRGLDHILISDSINLQRIAVINHPLSDHLPVAAEIELPLFGPAKSTDSPIIIP